jgi:protein ImuB
MSTSQALARCPGLQLLPASPREESILGRRLLRFAQTLSPRVEQQAPHRLLLDLQGVRTGKLQDWADSALARLKEELRVNAAMGVAGRPTLAWCAARRAAPVRVVDECEAFIESLTFAELEVSAPLQQVLEDWGIGTLGALLRLPKQAAMESLGAEASALWELASDSRENVLRLESFAEPLKVQTDFEHPVETLEPLLFTVNRHLEELCSRMRLLHRVASGMHLQLKLENAPPHDRHFNVPSPTCDSAVLLRIIETHLETLQMEAALNGVILRIHETLPHSEQLTLFESPLRDPNRFGETLARLHALTGEDRVGVPVRGDSHCAGRHLLLDPSKAFGSTKLSSRASSSGTTKARATTDHEAIHSPTPSLGLPLRRFRPAVEAQVELVSHRPAHVYSKWINGPVLDCRGPYRFSGEWWERKDWSREEWDVALGGHFEGLYRIACEHPPNGRWFLEGCYDAAQWPVPAGSVKPESRTAQGAPGE